jgi:uncharacterized FAD-dependent dehydrogenase
VYRLLWEIAPGALEAKPFALGVRVEHPRSLIDHIQFHRGRTAEEAGHLGAAEYALSAQVEGRGVYSFCMCPGGVLVPASSDPGGLVINGMSASGRSSPWSNAAIVVECRSEDFAASDGNPLAGLEYRGAIEAAALEAGGLAMFRHSETRRPESQTTFTGGPRAPAQRLEDFLAGRPSAYLPPSSYAPGLKPARLDLLFPALIPARLKAAFPLFDRQMGGFICPEALLVAPETRTSSPIRILRDKVTYESPALSGLYPAGEGSGYSGGITSSALDGENVAAAVIIRMSSEQ